jgi:hypothetical protein
MRAAIQSAIDEVGNLPPGPDGFRGAVLLKEGVYRISASLKMTKSGVVLQGAGDGHEYVKPHNMPFSPSNDMTVNGVRGAGYLADESYQAGVTKIITTWNNSGYNKSAAAVDISGGSGSNQGTVRYVRDQYVPAGETLIHLDDVSGISPGDTVVIRRNISEDWVDAIGMYGIPGASPRWPVSYFDLTMERTVVSVDSIAKTIKLLEPFTDSADYRWGIAEVRRYNTGGRIENVGVENIQVISGNYNKNIANPQSYYGVEYLFYSGESNVQTFVKFTNVQNAWLKNFVTYHLDVAASLQNGVKNITIQDGQALDPISAIGSSGNRYTYSINNAYNVLIQRCFTRYPRHAFYIGSQVSGPNVFRDCSSQWNMNSSEPHFRWSSGGLYELITGGRVSVQNRWNNGTSHGWAGVNYVLWNCGRRGEPNDFIISQPSIAPNYAIGLVGNRIPFEYNVADYAKNNPAYEYRIGTNVLPESLYLAQLEDRLGPGAVVNAEN